MCFLIGIYKIQNKINRKVYIGQSDNLQRRIRANRNVLSRNEHHNHMLQQEYNKYGAENYIFEIICECKISELDLMEQKYIAAYKATNCKYGYNIEIGNTTNNLKKQKNRHNKSDNFSNNKKKPRIIKSGFAPNGKQLYSIIYHGVKVKSSVNPMKLVEYLQLNYFNIVNNY